jgi:poly [ADP-ribose] polymerase
MGIELFSAKADQDTIIKNKLGSISDKFVRGFRIENKKTQKQMDEFLKKSKNKKTELFWHGSRNENWLPIIQSGLVLRPTNAVISGKMFGYGTYFADKAIKSYGYTSGRGSYWANGSSPEAFMSLYEVHVGNQLHIKRHESWCSSLDEKKLKAKGEYDSLFAEGGADLRNNEFIVYNESQTTIKYIVELKG